jgi:tetratricopeptide (TPR) repeat protein
MKYWFVIILFVTPFWSCSQSITKIEITKTVFRNLAQAYANSKNIPTLNILPKSINTSIPARYRIINNSPVIEVDEKLINLCFKMGQDSLNALAIILSHELAHYYNDHEWCSDYAFAQSKKNEGLSKKLKEASINAKTEKEATADRHGLFYASAAGYNVFSIYSSLLSKVYEYYKFPSIQIGYPSLSERQKMANDASKKSKELFGFFKSGIKALNENRFDNAISDFEKANSYIPYRENFNNLGVAKTRKALLIKPKSYEEVNFPERFLYPLEIENKTRLSQEDTRGIDEGAHEEMTKLLKSAQKDFQEAIRIDPQFTKGFINLACVYDLLGNPDKAIGEIKGLSREQQNSVESKIILAIAYFHNSQEALSNKIWNELKIR